MCSVLSFCILKYLNSFLDRPRISSFFERRTFENNLLQLTCVADGSPEPSYTFRTSNGTELAQINNGVVIISNYSSTLNESYTCIAKNKLGEVERRLKVEFDSRSPGKTVNYYILEVHVLN